MAQDARRDALEAALQRFGEAWAAGEMEVLTDLLSPTYTHNDAMGAHLNRAEWLAYAAKRTGRATQITFRDVATRVFGDMAIVTGFNDMSGGGILNAQDRRDLSIAFTQVWRWENGRWLREAFQATPVQDQTYA